MYFSFPGASGRLPLNQSDAGPGLFVQEDRVRTVHSRREVHRLGAERLPDRIDVVVDQENRGDSLFGPELDLLL
jgi:hypothetical protein